MRQRVARLLYRAPEPIPTLAGVVLLAYHLITHRGN